MITRTTIDMEELYKYLVYNPDSGIFTRKIGTGGIKRGTVAGCIGALGYIQIKINRKIYKAHRLAWAYVYGEQPENIDHINGNKSDNRISNLRPASCAENQYNTKIIHNKTSYRGVDFSDKNFTAVIVITGVTQYLGMYPSAEEAAIVYENKAKEIQGEFYVPPVYLNHIKDIMPNKIVKSINPTGYEGVSAHGVRYRTRISINGVRIHIGVYDTPEEAYAAYLNKKKELGRI